MQNKIVFTQKELTSLSTLGLLHSVQGFGSIGRKIVTYNFIHLAVQELLAAHYISRLEPAEHSEQFEKLLKNLKFPILQFYAGLTGLTNASVRNFIAGFRYAFHLYDEKHQHYFLAFFNCIFEAQIRDRLFYEQMIPVHKFNLFFLGIPLSPMDCLSLHYFFSSIRTMGRRQIELDITLCNIDDQSLSKLLGSSGVLESVEILKMAGNEYTDAGIDCITRAISNSILKTLQVGNSFVTDIGLESLLEALPRQHSLVELVLLWSSPHPDESLKKIGECVENSTGALKMLRLYPRSPSLQSEEAVKEWVKRVAEGGKSLIHSLENCPVDDLSFNISLQTIGLSSDIDLFSNNTIEIQLRSLFRQTITTVHLGETKTHIDVSCTIGFKSS